MTNIAANLETVYERIQQAAQRANRPASEITLVAVTKTHPLETVIEAYQAGLRHFGENRVEEGVDKAAAFGDWLAQQPDSKPATWHFVGHIQSRKAGDMLAGQFGLAHSVDSLKLAERVNRLAKRDDYPNLDILLQCNVSGEEAKYGFELSRWRSQPEQWDDFCQSVTKINALDKVTIRGLMTMAPLVDNPEKARPTFKSLSALRSKLQTEMPDIDWRHLSMGMTDDFEVAIEEGATVIRVGRAIFGERHYT